MSGVVGIAGNNIKAAYPDFAGAHKRLAIGRHVHPVFEGILQRLQALINQEDAGVRLRSADQQWLSPLDHYEMSMTRLVPGTDRTLALFGTSTVREQVIDTSLEKRKPTISGWDAEKQFGNIHPLAYSLMWTRFFVGEPTPSTTLASVLSGDNANRVTWFGTRARNRDLVFPDVTEQLIPGGPVGVRNPAPSFEFTMPRTMYAKLRPSGDWFNVNVVNWANQVVALFNDYPCFRLNDTTPVSNTSDAAASPADAKFHDMLLTLLTKGFTAEGASTRQDKATIQIMISTPWFLLIASLLFHPSVVNTPADILNCPPRWNIIHMLSLLDPSINQLLAPSVPQFGANFPGRLLAHALGDGGNAWFVLARGAWANAAVGYDYFKRFDDIDAMLAPWQPAIPFSSSRVVCSAQAVTLVGFMTSANPTPAERHNADTVRPVPANTGFLPGLRQYQLDDLFSGQPAEPVAPMLRPAPGPIPAFRSLAVLPAARPGTIDERYWANMAALLVLDPNIRFHMVTVPSRSGDGTARLSYHWQSPHGHDQRTNLPLGRILITDFDSELSRRRAAFDSFTTGRGALVDMQRPPITYPPAARAQDMVWIEALKASDGFLRSVEGSAALTKIMTPPVYTVTCPSLSRTQVPASRYMRACVPIAPTMPCARVMMSASQLEAIAMFGPRTKVPISPTDVAARDLIALAPMSSCVELDAAWSAWAATHCDEGCMAIFNTARTDFGTRQALGAAPDFMLGIGGHPFLNEDGQVEPTFLSYFTAPGACFYRYKPNSDARLNRILVEAARRIMGNDISVGHGITFRRVIGRPIPLMVHDVAVPMAPPIPLGAAPAPARPPVVPPAGQLAIDVDFDFGSEVDILNAISTPPAAPTRVVVSFGPVTTVRQFAPIATSMVEPLLYGRPICDSTLMPYGDPVYTDAQFITRDGKSFSLAVNNRQYALAVAAAGAAAIAAGVAVPGLAALIRDAHSGVASRQAAPGIVIRGAAVPFVAIPQWLLDFEIWVSMMGAALTLVEAMRVFRMLAVRNADIFEFFPVNVADVTEAKECVAQFEPPLLLLDEPSDSAFLLTVLGKAPYTLGEIVPVAVPWGNTAQYGAESQRVIDAEANGLASVLQPARLAAHRTIENCLATPHILTEVTVNVLDLVGLPVDCPSISGYLGSLTVSEVLSAPVVVPPTLEWALLLATERPFSAWKAYNGVPTPGVVCAPTSARIPTMRHIPLPAGLAAGPQTLSTVMDQTYAAAAAAVVAPIQPPDRLGYGAPLGLAGLAPRQAPRPTNYTQPALPAVSILPPHRSKPGPLAGHAVFATHGCFASGKTQHIAVPQRTVQAVAAPFSSGTVVHTFGTVFPADFACACANDALLGLAGLPNTSNVRQRAANLDCMFQVDAAPLVRVTPTITELAAWIASSYLKVLSTNVSALLKVPPSLEGDCEEVAPRVA